jgi:uncharacterized RDD family membrane protein YckC
MSQPREFITPEHVLIRLLPAGLGSRFLAFMLDLLVIMLLLYLLDRFFAIFPQSVHEFIRYICFFVLMWGYHIYFELCHEGRSFGKRAFDLRVVDGRGLPLALGQSFIRNIVRALDVVPWAYAVGGSCALLDPHSRRLGDIVADTLVVEDARTSGYQGELSQAPRYNSLRAPRVQRLIRHRIGLEEREFLLALCLRSGRLREAERFKLLEEVGNYYRQRLEIDDPHLSGENLIRNLTALLYSR